VSFDSISEGRPGPRSFDPDVIESVVGTLEQGHLFRYDCESPESSETALFEREFAARVGARYAVAVNSCSSALFLALLASGVQRGDEVLLPAFTFIAVPSAVVHVGATPVLLEMTDDLAIDPDDLERKISDRTSALLLSYMRGHVPDLERVLEVCAGRGVLVIEDVAHGMGVQWDGVPLGRFGRASAFSFQSYKLMDGGEGGMLLLAGCYDRNWRLHFLPEDDLAWLEAAVNSFPAFGLRMSNLTASALRPQMARIDDRVAIHRDRYLQVVAELADCPIRLPAHSDRVRPAPDSIQFEVPTLAPAQLERFVAHCNALGVPLQVFGLDPANSRCFWNWRFSEFGDCPRTRDLLSRLADVPLPLWLDDRSLSHFVNVIRTSLIEAGAGEG
jgi:perosamine synthetase